MKRKMLASTAISKYEKSLFRMLTPLPIDVRLSHKALSIYTTTNHWKAFFTLAQDLSRC